MTQPAVPRVRRPNGNGRSAEARLARLHLRGGLLTLARAELEQMAGAGTLDREALADLAEARWRSGDLDGAAEAAEAHVQAGGNEPMAHLIAAEALDRKGHLIDARGHSSRVIDQLGPGGLDRLFAGEARSSAWPPPVEGSMDTRATTPGRWGLLVGGQEVADPTVDTWPLVPPPSASGEPAETGNGRSNGHTTPPARPATPSASTAGGWAGPVRPGASTAEQMEAGRAAGVELEVVEGQLAKGELDGAPDRLALLLRMDRALAPVIISLADRAVAGAPSGDPNLPALHVLRGDAFRGMGRDIEASEAYEQAVHAIAARTSPEEHT